MAMRMLSLYCSETHMILNALLAPVHETYPFDNRYTPFGNQT